MKLSVVPVVAVSTLVLVGCALEEPPAPVPARERAFALDRRIAATPPMGWNSWNQFDCDIDEQLVRQQAEAMVTSGMQAVGYRYINIDDCWMADRREPDGVLPPHPRRFAGGIRALADQVHRLGLELGIYSSPGPLTCQGRPGSAGFEEIDARSYASWGVDYLKYDRCSAPTEGLRQRFERMGQALAATGREIVLSINAEVYETSLGDRAGGGDRGEPGAASDPHPWREVAHLWRVAPDIKPVWSWTPSPSIRGIIDIVDINADRAPAAGPGAWNDPDMLEVGVSRLWGFPPFIGLSETESRTHFSLWAIMAAPLIAGNDLTSMSETTRQILTNAEVIAVDQDPLGIQGTRVRDEGELEVWSKPLAEDGARAVVLLNRTGLPARVTARWSELQLDAGPAAVRDLWQHADLGVFSAAYTATVAGHGVVMLLVRGVPDTDAYEAEAPVNRRLGGARVMQCMACSGARSIGYLGRGGELEFSAVQAQRSGLHRIAVHYTAPEARGAFVSVNGAPAVELRFAATTSPGTLVAELPLAAGDNRIRWFHPAGWAPDIDRIELVD
jgi:alpha-galactosidase